MPNATQLREEALAALLDARTYAEAHGLEDNDGELDEGAQTTFDEKMATFRDLDAKAQKSVSTGESVGTLRERFEWYAGKATGGPVPFSTRQIQPDTNAGKSLGQLFVESSEYAELVRSGSLGSDRSAFRSDPFKAATTDVIHSTPGSGGGAALVTPEYYPGIIGLPQRPLTIRALFGSGTTATDTISYAQQATFEPATGMAVKQATGPADAASVKKQSSFSYERKTSPVETIATWVAATRQQLADAGQLRALIDNNLRLMLQLEEEDQLLNGNGTSPNLSGVYDQPIQTSDVTGVTSNGEPNIDGIRNAARLVKVGISRLTADGVVMNPTDSMYLDLTVDGESRYRVGDPFAQGVGAGPRPIWGLRRVESEAIEVGHALVGAFSAGATVLERQGITILTADQHADFFVRNLVVVLAEERLGFPVFYPSAFVDLTLDAWSNVIGS